MKSIRIAALSCLLVAAMTVGCSDDEIAAFLPLIEGTNVGTVAADKSAAEIVGDVNDDCGGGCDGILDDDHLDGLTSDADGLEEILFGSVLGDPLDIEDITSQDDYEDAIAELTEATELTFNVTRTTDCDSGIIREAIVLRGTFDAPEMAGAKGDLDTAEDVEIKLIVTFAGCRLEGIEVGAASEGEEAETVSVIINGTYTFTDTFEGGSFSVGEDIPAADEVAALAGNLNIFGTGGFWSTSVNFNAFDNWGNIGKGDPDSAGGVCAGAAVDMDLEQTEGDDSACAETSNPTAFWGSWIVEYFEFDGAPCWDC